MRLGATFVSPFIGWKEETGEETVRFIQEIVMMRDNYEFPTEIIVSAVRNGRQIVDSAVAGADIVTCGPRGVQGHGPAPVDGRGAEAVLQLLGQDAVRISRG